MGWSGQQPVAQIAKDLGISQSCLRRWMSVDDIDAAAGQERRRSQALLIRTIANVMKQAATKTTMAMRPARDFGW